MKDLPESWSRIEITEVLEANNNGKPFQQGWSPRCESFPAPEGKWGVLTTTSIQNGEFWDHEHKFLPDHLEPRPHLEVKLGDVLITCAGPRVRCGVACLVERTRPKLMMSGKMYRFKPHPEVMYPKYLAYMLQTPEAQLEIDRMKTGINDSGLNLTHSRFAALKVAVAPLNEQHRIVVKIEELLSELDKGIESLKTAEAQLKVYRQAVLRHAFEGKLTAQWREENKDKLEKPEQLVARIKQEREARYVQQFRDWKAAVKKWEEGGSLDRKPSRPRPPSFPEPFSDIEKMAFPEISEVWRWAKVGELFSVYVGATPSRKNRNYWNGEINWITSGEVRFAPINKTNETVTLEGLANASTEIHPIGTVMLAMIGEGKTRGQAAVTQVEACHNQNAAAIRVSESEIPPEYVYYYLLYRYEDTRRVGSGNNQKALNKERVSNLPIPLPVLDEQAVVVKELKKLLSVIQQLDGEIGSQLASVSSLRQSILTKAFNGRLVAQDPRDEPASVLLDGIRAEGEKALKNNRSKKTGKRKKTA